MDLFEARILKTYIGFCVAILILYGIYLYACRPRRAPEPHIIVVQGAPDDGPQRQVGGAAADLPPPKRAKRAA